MKKIINKQNIKTLCKKNMRNSQNGMKEFILEILRCNFEEILKSNKFTKQDLENISYNVSNDDELINFIGNLIVYELEKFKKTNYIK